jgi:hypothetical protein
MIEKTSCFCGDFYLTLSTWNCLKHNLKILARSQHYCKYAANFFRSRSLYSLDSRASRPAPCYCVLRVSPVQKQYRFFTFHFLDMASQSWIIRISELCLRSANCLLNIFHQFQDYFQFHNYESGRDAVNGRKASLVLTPPPSFHTQTLLSLRKHISAIS